jgi:hypothetical protein
MKFFMMMEEKSFVEFFRKRNQFPGLLSDSVFELIVNLLIQRDVRTAMFRNLPDGGKFRPIAGFLHDVPDALHDIRMGIREIVGFPDVGVEVVEFDGFLGAADAYAFPFAHSDRLLFALLVFPVEIFPWCLLIGLPQQGGHHGDAVGVGRDVGVA